MYIDRKFDRLFELELCFPMPTNVRPLYVGHVHSHLPHGAWTRVSHGSFDVRERAMTMSRKQEGSFIPSFFQPTEGVEPSVPNKGSKVSAYKPMGIARNKGNLLRLEAVARFVQVQL